MMADAIVGVLVEGSTKFIEGMSLEGELKPSRR
jgi:hypothetical protein